MKGIIGGLIVIMSFILFCTTVENEANDNYWYSRPYTLVEKNEGGHEHKGRYYSDYYFTVKYDDDKYTLWTESVSGTKYFSQHVNQRYVERTENQYHIYGVLFLALLLIIGFILLGNYFVYDLEF